MKWFGHRESGNVEDRRGMSGGKVIAGGGIIGVIILLINMFSGNIDLSQVVDTQSAGSAPTQPLTAADEETGKFMRVLLADTEDVWAKLFEQNGQAYRPTTLVLFRGSVDTGCGSASSEAGPFYCPEDQKVYMDMAFFEQLRTRYGARGGDFAIAYVLAHEVGHHVQHLLGTSDEVQQAMQQSSETESNRLSVQLELQADFYAGVWAHHSEAKNRWLEAGDVDEALSAANAVGDDALQKRLQGAVVPDSFTHGSSAQRMAAFLKGFNGGILDEGSLFVQ
ncbi:MAG: metalloprotease [Flavobacterium sp. BFFFF1]|uniref:KPN_02809 family neutral zinc metallopeptidase n=1 Tax=Flavobacterium sp. BFFFF1 TaxID=2015557 RepID=UPI000BC90E5D|nr:neutral zinc metallopeptidase [Flavobacterium sp. BFFFF1]OYU79270.1 MAG: metalloprotease [Flavobacterium sp. BFFFF1]